MGLPIVPLCADPYLMSVHKLDDTQDNQRVKLEWQRSQIRRRRAALLDERNKAPKAKSERGDGDGSDADLHHQEMKKLKKEETDLQSKQAALEAQTKELQDSFTAKYGATAGWVYGWESADAGMSDERSSSSAAERRGSLDNRRGSLEMDEGKEYPWIRISIAESEVSSSSVLELMNVLAQFGVSPS
jgi:hypothetical protein